MLPEFLSHGGSAGQEVSRAMLQQMQHIQHAGADLTAEELRFSTSDLLQALKVCVSVLLCSEAYCVLVAFSLSC